MKHVEIDFYFIRDEVAQGLLNIVHIPSKNQLANTLTKALPRALFVALRFKLRVHDGTPIGVITQYLVNICSTYLMWLPSSYTS